MIRHLLVHPLRVIICASSATSFTSRVTFSRSLSRTPLSRSSPILVTEAMVKVNAGGPWNGGSASPQPRAVSCPASPRGCHSTDSRPPGSGQSSPCLPHCLECCATPPDSEELL